MKIIPIDENMDHMQITNVLSTLRMKELLNISAKDTRKLKNVLYIKKLVDPYTINFKI